MFNFIVIGLVIALLVFAFKKMTSGHSQARTKHYQSIDDQYNEKKAKEQEELDYLLDKIHQKGINHLSHKEKARLKELSKDH